MSPQHCEYYQTLKQDLSELKLKLDQAEPSPELIANFWQVQLFFQQQLLPLSFDSLSPAIAARFRSYQTEIHKQLRLLGTDLTFLKTSRQAATIKQRRVQISDRLQTLISYCDALIQSSET